MLKHINTLTKDIQRHPFEGLGDPEPLKHNWSGYSGLQSHRYRPASLSLLITAITTAGSGSFSPFSMASQCECSGGGCERRCAVFAGVRICIWSMRQRRYGGDWHGYPSPGDCGQGFTQRSRRPSRSRSGNPSVNSTSLGPPGLA
ncbi:type II toxin-antitoxin system YoeB family toxin [Oceanobacter mangrovi]|uniref:type II toxin-antitoxin system YoeB family toxin n=1 Tax=Oceanobacter mangrovi TaxID=2862510 RepID=UPI001C8D076D